MGSTPSYYWLICALGHLWDFLILWFMLDLDQKSQALTLEVEEGNWDVLTLMCPHVGLCSQQQDTDQLILLSILNGRLNLRTNTNYIKEEYTLLILFILNVFKLTYFFKKLFIFGNSLNFLCIDKDTIDNFTW